MMRRYSLPILGMMAVVCFGLPCLVVAADDGPVVVLADLPDSGRTGQVVSALTQSLPPRLFSLRGQGDAAGAGQPDLLIAYSGVDYDAGDIAAVNDFVRAGGALLYLYGGTDRHIEPANALLKDLRLGLTRVNTPRQEVKLAKHKVTDGVQALPDSPYRTTVTGGNRWPIIRQGRFVVGATAAISKGRAAVLPLTMVTATGSGEPTPDQIRLLTNACYWLADRRLKTIAGGRGGPSVKPPTTFGPPPVRPGAIEDKRKRRMRKALERDRRAATDDHSGRILVDILAADDRWDIVAEMLDKSLATTGAPVDYLDAAGTASPLVDALQKPPGLLVIGSTRQFTLDEAVAVAHYADMGGRILFLCHATRDYAIRLVDLNTILREFGVSVSLIRPKNATLLETHPITASLKHLPEFTWGVNIWSGVATPVAKAGARPFLSTLESDNARIVIVDGKTLLVGTKAIRSPIKEGPPQPFVPLVEAAIDWLLENHAQ